MPWQPRLLIYESCRQNEQLAEPIVGPDAFLGHASCGARAAPSLARMTSTLGMPIALAVLAFFLLWIARYIGEQYGWYYHSLILVALGVSLAALFRLTLLKLPNKPLTLPPTDDPERIKLHEKILLMNRNLEHSRPAFLRDLVLLPVLACCPAALILLIFRQRSYQADHSIWFQVSLIPLLIYVVFRIATQKHLKKNA